MLFIWWETQPTKVGWVHMLCLTSVLGWVPLVKSLSLLPYHLLVSSLHHIFFFPFIVKFFFLLVSVSWVSILPIPSLLFLFYSFSLSMFEVLEVETEFSKGGKELRKNKREEGNWFGAGGRKSSWNGNKEEGSKRILGLQRREKKE